jgi:hypothetical protein
MSLARTGRITLCILLTAVLAGCGAVEQARNAAKKQQLGNFLKQVGLGFHSCHDAMSRGPADWAELQKFGVPAEVQQILQTEGYMIIFWNVKLSDVAGGTSNFIAAYPSDAATNGGLVLLLDGAVQQVTAQEFNDMMAKQKTDSPAAMAASAGGAGGGAAPAGGTPPADGTAPPGPPAPPGS